VKFHLTSLFIVSCIFTLTSVSFLAHEDSLLMIHDAWRAHLSLPFIDYSMPWGGVSSILGASTLSLFGGELKGLWYASYSLVFNLFSTYLVYVLLLKHTFNSRVAYFSSLFFTLSYTLFFGGFYVDYLSITIGLLAIYLIGFKNKHLFLIAAFLLALGFYVKQTTGAIVLISSVIYVFTLYQFKLKSSMGLLLISFLFILGIFFVFYFSEGYVNFRNNFYELPLQYSSVENNKSISNLLLSFIYPLNLNLISDKGILYGSIIFIPALLAIYFGYLIIVKEITGNDKNYRKASLLIFMLLITVATSASTGRDLPHRLFFSFTMIPIISSYLKIGVIRIFIPLVSITPLILYFVYRVSSFNSQFDSYVSYPIIYNNVIKQKLSYDDFETAVNIIKSLEKDKKIYLMDDRLLTVSAAVENPIIGNKLYYDINLTIPKSVEGQKGFYANEFKLIKQSMPEAVIIPLDTCNRFMRSNKCLDQTIYEDFKLMISSMYRISHYGQRILIYLLKK